MSNENSYLALRFEGPMQSWGFDSQFNRRNTGLWPTKSAIAGMICAAFGYERGSQEEYDFLNTFTHIKMTAISIPRIVNNSRDEKELMVRRLTDYHTVEGTVRASGSLNPNAVLTHRQYLNDASFGVVLSGNSILLEAVGKQLKDPIWGIWLGRKSCIPTAPVFAGIYQTENDAIEILTNKKSGDYMTQKEVNTFSEGKDSISDQATTFISSSRSFAPRRVKVEVVSVK